MPCIVVPFANGGHAHLCVRATPKRRCRFCNSGYVERLCDFPVNAKGKTCDAGMCGRCATSIARDIDYCPRHKGQTAALPQPVQGELAL